ncbi:amidase signature enzyme [Calocera viscosa TUFC12733]|uniref:Amidase signature enzyme n=1 Tax=Calocera viscosa (strain TUFC12733) TaxID=1330018 RepID=A0A167FJF1_CALVF|nr:amidase signature enzyme [Calocera viscosa TUFC12733]
MLSFETQTEAYYNFEPQKTALVLVDMQRDFLEAGGFGDIQSGGNLQAVRAVVAPIMRLLNAARDAGLTVIHTREGHAPDLSDCPTPKLNRQRFDLKIGDVGRTGSRLLIRGEAFHDIVPSLAPFPGEFVIDKTGKGAFYRTDLHPLLVDLSISHLLICGVTTECCVFTTATEANDRGFEVCIVSDCTDGYQPIKDVMLNLFCSADGLLGYVADSARIISALELHSQALTESAPVSWNGRMEIEKLSACYRKGILEPETVIAEVYNRIRAPDADPAVWLHLMEEDSVRKYARELASQHSNLGKLPPLYGVPFSVKNSIDYEGVPTTAACPAYSYIPQKHATAVRLLLEAGAIFIGTVNLDQLATGLVGMRSPYGAPASTFSRLHVSGGSSSGSAVSVSAGQVSFSLATDTAGSGRVPAAFNNIIGLKPTPGRVPITGVVPCCPSLDCIALECSSVSDAQRIFHVLRGFDRTDPFAKSAIPTWAFGSRAVLQPGATFKFGTVPKSSDSWKYLCPEFERLFSKALGLMASPSVGGIMVDHIDYSIFEDAGRLLYEGSFVAERVSSIQQWYNKHPAPASVNDEDCLLPEIRHIYATAAKNFTARDAWEDKSRMAFYQRKAQEQFENFQVLIVPTAPLHPTKSEYKADPISLNHKLGKFTHYGNILDMCGVACPAGFTSDGMPFGITILGQSFSEGLILDIAGRFERAVGSVTGKYGSGR